MKNVFAAILLCVTTVAGAQPRILTGKTWIVYSTLYPSDAHQRLLDDSLDHGASNVALVVTGEPSHPYLVMTRYTCGSCGFFPPDSYLSAIAFQSVPAAVAEYDQHQGATLRGLITMPDGVVLVYWSK